MDHIIPVIQVDATQNNSAVRLASGRFQRWRRMIVTPLILLFVLSPWLTFKGAPLLWMDLPHRELHVFGLVFWPDDYLMLTWLAMAAAFGLFAVATFSGRLWCGFACPQTIWSMMFIWVEEKTQGSRQKRLKELKLPWYKRRLLPLFLKHSLWMLIACVTGFTFVAFFETGEQLWLDITHANVSLSVLFWLCFFSIMTYLNGGWLREQVCLHMCPYSRFQSVMLDKKSLKVTYQTERGEPRRNEGDCIDCSLCVQVCPVGIDIRQGLQYACIDCAACIDVCDDVMEKVNKPTGLIQFAYEGQATAESIGMTTGDAPAASELKAVQSQKHAIFTLLKGRQKLWGYAILALLSAAAFTLQVWFSEDLDAHLSRDRGQMYLYNGEGQLANRYQLKLHNKSREAATYRIHVQNPELMLTTPSSVYMSSREVVYVRVEVQCAAPCPLDGTQEVALLVERADHEGDHATDSVLLSSRFFAPRL